MRFHSGFGFLRYISVDFPFRQATGVNDASSLPVSRLALVLHMDVETSFVQSLDESDSIEVPRDGTST